MPPTAIGLLGPQVFQHAGSALNALFQQAEDFRAHIKLFSQQIVGDRIAMFMAKRFHLGPVREMVFRYANEAAPLHGAAHVALNALTGIGTETHAGASGYLGVIIREISVKTRGRLHQANVAFGNKIHAADSDRRGSKEALERLQAMDHETQVGVNELIDSRFSLPGLIRVLNDVREFPFTIGRDAGITRDILKIAFVRIPSLCHMLHLH